MKKDNVYKGLRGDWSVVVTVNGQPLPLRLDLVNKSPTGFEWGFGGSGPSQLALAILAFELDDLKALECYQHFTWSVIAGLTGDAWEITADDIRAWIFNFEMELDRLRDRGMQLNAGPL